MDRKGKTVSKESDTALEYYRLYSDNNQLPKYFCGGFDEVAHVQAPPSAEDKGQDEHKGGRNPSPTSSVASTRKLEWDYGADIGYENKYKSLSLPVLSVAETGPNTSKESQEKRCDSEDDKKSCKSFASGKSEGKAKEIESLKRSDGEDSETQKRLSDDDNKNSSGGKSDGETSAVCNAEILNYIKARVGVPIAHSTPFAKLEISETVAFEIKGDSSDKNLPKDTSSESSKKSSSSSDINELKMVSNKNSTSSESSSNGVKIVTIDSSSDSNNLPGIKVVSIESSSDSDVQAKETQSSSSSGETYFTLQNKISSQEPLERYVELYTPKIVKEKKVQNIQTLIEDSEKCIRVGLENERLLKERKHVLGPTCFYYEIKEPAGELLTGGTERALSSGSKVNNSSERSVEETLKLEAGDKNEGLILPKSNECLDEKLKNLVLTKPVYVECLDTMINEETIDSLDAVSSKRKLVPESVRPLNEIKPDKIKTLNLEDAIYGKASSRVNTTDKNPQTSFLVEYLDPQLLRDKNVQTSSENVSVGIQTEKKRQTLYSSNTNSSPHMNSNAVFSECDSFEFLNGSECESNRAVNDYHLKKLKRSAVKSDLTNLTSNSSSSKENCLSDLLTHGRSVEIDKRLELLQRLYKSKKYDKETKRYYMRKVLKSILNTQSSEDNSVCSEKITPNIAVKKDGILSFGNVCGDENKNADHANSGGQYLKERVQNSDIQTSAEEQDCYAQKVKHKERENHVNKEEQKRFTQKHREDCNNANKQHFPVLEDGNVNRVDKLNEQECYSDNSRLIHLKTNVPWVPQVAPKSDKRDEPASKTTSSTSSAGKNVEKPRFQVYSPKKTFSCNLHKSPKKSSSRKSKSSHMNQTAGSDNNESNWKENKTLSEQLLEIRSRKLSSGDSTGSPNEELLFFAKRERENQLCWINNEIEHLVKLKDLLEKRGKHKSESREKNFESREKKPHDSIEELNKVKKSTAIYMITTERSEGKCGEEEVPIRSSIIRNGDISQTKFVVRDDKGTKAYKVHELQTGSLSSASTLRDKIRKNAEDSKTTGILENKQKSASSDRDSDSTRKCFCRPKTSNSQKSSYLKCECGKKTTSSIPSKELYVWNRCEEDSVALGDNSSQRSIKSNLNSDSQKINYSAAVLISNTIKPSLTNPGDSVRRLILEIPLDSREKPSQVSREDVESASKEVQTSKTLLKSSTESTTSSESSRGSSSTSTEGSFILCSCCRKLIAASESSLAINSELYTNLSPPPVFCQPCFAESKKQMINPQSPYFQQPQHQCNCYNSNINNRHMNSNFSSGPFNTNTNNAPYNTNTNNVPYSTNTNNGAFSMNTNNGAFSMNTNNGAFSANTNNSGFNRNTGHLNANALDPDSINKIRKTLKELEELEECEKYCQCLHSKFSSNNDTCKMCKCKVKLPKGSKKPVAYLLTFEAGEAESPKLKNKVRSLEEVRVKVPSLHKSRKKKQPEPAKVADDKEDGGHRKHKNSKHKIKKTLQEYLESNNPSFVKAAEERRKCMIDLAYMREQRCEKYKQLLALTNGIPMQKPGYSNIHQKRLFTSKEMKTMTAKKYKKLPEVRQKLVDNRTKQIKKANRLLADIFNKKLRERVLLGNPNISASTSVINLM